MHMFQLIYLFLTKYSMAGFQVICVKNTHVLDPNVSGVCVLVQVKNYSFLKQDQELDRDLRKISFFVCLFYLFMKMTFSFPRETVCNRSSKYPVYSYFVCALQHFLQEGLDQKSVQTILKNDREKDSLFLLFLFIIAPMQDFCKITFVMSIKEYLCSSHKPKKF